MKNLSLLLSNFGYRFLFTVIGLALTNNVYACSSGFYEYLIVSLSTILAIILLLISFRVSKGEAYFIRIIAIILSLPLILLILLIGGWLYFIR